MRSEARSEPASGSLKSWQKSCSAGSTLRQPALLLLGCAMSQQGGADEVDADPSHQLRRSGTRQLLLHDVVVQRAETAAAVCLGPGHADEAGRGELRLPVAQEGDLLGQVVEERWQPDPVLPRQLGFEPPTALGAELLLLLRGRQVHRRAGLVHA